MTTFVYVLKCPAGLVRYVGKSNTPNKRYKQHLSSQNLSKLSHKNNWLNSLISKDQMPLLEIIEECDDTLWHEKEVEWIRYYRSIGVDLTNSTDGGEGVHGYTFTEEAKENMSKAHIGLKPSEDTRKKLSKAQLGNKKGAGKKMPQHLRDLLSKLNKERVVSDETKEKLRLANLGKSNSTKGSTLPDLMKQQISESVKNIPKKECHYCLRLFPPGTFSR